MESNDKINAALREADNGFMKHVSEAMTHCFRARERRGFIWESIYARIRKVTNEELEKHPDPNQEMPVVYDEQPQKGFLAVSLYPHAPDGFYVDDGFKPVIPFFKLQTPEATHNVDELRAYTGDIREKVLRAHASYLDFQLETLFLNALTRVRVKYNFQDFQVRSFELQPQTIYVEKKFDLIRVSSVVSLGVGLFGRTDA